MTLNKLAEKYVKLVLAVGKHHNGYVDAYYGPSQWLTIDTLSLKQITQQTIELIAQLKDCDIPPDQTLRHAFLLKQVQSIVTFIRIIEKQPPSFDEESLALYDAISPHISDCEFDNILDELNALIPGGEGLSQRIVNFNSQFEIPKNKLDSVFTASVERARSITKEFISLEAHESFSLEYVNGKVWSGYNWYKGNSYSLIQMNTDFPIYISRAVDLAAHEGYPGHHAFNSLMETHLVNQKGWIEYCVYPLFSPMSLLAEGSANYGIDVVFPIPERMKFEKEVLFPLAGLDAQKAEVYYQVQAFTQKLSYADNMIAKRLLDREINASEAIDLLIKYTLVSSQKAKQRLGFIQANRAYVLNYNLGQDLVKAYVERHANMDDINDVWRVFGDLLINPRTASMLI